MYPFEVLIHGPFNDFKADAEMKPTDNAHCMFSVNDYEDGHWRYGKFYDFIWDNIKETALSAKERTALLGSEGRILSRAAKKLRITDHDKAGGEIAEIFLYGVMKHYYGALPVVPKIFYKQNRNDYAKGADSVHVVIEQEGKVSLWLGEAKFYNGVENDRLEEIVESVFDTLDTEKIRKENSIITNVQDIDHLDIPEEKKKEIEELLSEERSIDLLKPHLHIPIMILYESPLTERTKSYTEDYKKEIVAYYKERVEAYLKKQLEKCKERVRDYEKITFHIMLFPVPDKAKIVRDFMNTANAHRIS